MRFLLALLVLVGLAVFYLRPSPVPSSIDALAEQQLNNFVSRWDGGPSALIRSYEANAICAFSSETAPIAGLVAIEANLTKVLGPDGPLHATKIEGTTGAVESLPGGYFRAHGSYTIRDAAGAVLDQGLWGNVSREADGGPLLVQESAHTTIPEGAVLLPPEGDPGSAEVEGIPVGDPELEAHFQRFFDAWNRQDAAAITEEFSEDAWRIVAAAPEPFIGRDAIRRSFEENFGESSPFRGSTLKGIPLHVRMLDAEHAIASGVWRMQDAEGTLIARGLWGNLYRREDGRWRMLMESAGAAIFE